MEIRANPVNADGQPTSPVVWDANCLEEVCGSCTMVINGKTRQSCTALVDQLGDEITLEPMRKFPVERDLIVNRQRMFDALKRVKAWVPMDGYYDLGPGQKIAPSTQEENYVMSTCMTCGCCLDVCPNYNHATPFVGAAAINQARLFNANPIGKLNRHERLEALMGEGGIAWCGNSQNCVQACPKGIPLTESIAEMNMQVNLYALRSFFRGRPGREGGSAGPAG
jgi:succinate dehydrogenase / fumarate reductase iron-sulfur subunit